MSKPSMLPVPIISNTPSFIGMYQHLFVCHLLCPTDFQHPPPCPHFKFFQLFSSCFSQYLGLCCIQRYSPNCALYNSLLLLAVQFSRQHFSCPWTMSLLIAIRTCMFLVVPYPSSNIKIMVTLDLSIQYWEIIVNNLETTGPILTQFHMVILISYLVL